MPWQALAMDIQIENKQIGRRARGTSWPRSASSLASRLPTFECKGAMRVSTLRTAPGPASHWTRPPRARRLMSTRHRQDAYTIRNRASCGLPLSLELWCRCSPQHSRMPSGKRANAMLARISHA
eukprot:4382367-Pleurochrysis_carterae.AAC.5